MTYLTEPLSIPIPKAIVAHTTWKECTHFSNSGCVVNTVSVFQIESIKCTRTLSSSYKKHDVSVMTSVIRTFIVFRAILNILYSILIKARLRSLDLLSSLLKLSTINHNTQATETLYAAHVQLLPVLSLQSDAQLSNFDIIKF